MAYRGDHVEEPVPVYVEVHRDEFAMYRRAAALVEATDDLAYCDTHGRRGSHRVMVDLALKDDWGYAVGEGPSFVAAMEDALDLPPVEVFLPRTETPRVPWLRFVVFGAALAEAVRWIFW